MRSNFFKKKFKCVLQNSICKTDHSINNDEWGIKNF